ncbi:MAG: copper-binding protein [Steroidobacteraceae bacterium]
MKSQIIAALSLALLAGSAGMAADIPAMKTAPPAAGAAERLQTAHAVGTVKSLDSAKGTITLSHEPVPAIKWPAMTMGFKISKELAANIKQGDKVNFDFTTKGMDATVTKIVVMK